MIEPLNTKKSWGRMLALVALTWALGSAEAATNPNRLELPAVIDDNMVLQRGQAVPIWGWAAPGAKVTVQFAGRSQSATADASGRWMIRLHSLSANTNSASMTITADETLVLTNILVGEVWLASGQSNMEKPLGEQKGQRPCVNATEELASADFPQIRLFKVEKGTMSTQPLKDLKQFTSWRACSSNALNEASFSAAAYYFARMIHTNLAVPVGVIETSWGGTRIEPWTPAEGFASVPSVAEFGQPQVGTNVITNIRPMMMYNSMIRPLVPFAIRGALWYQGESNCIGETNRLIYADKMAALINGWRKVWRQGDFPFYYVQLAPYAYSARKQVPPVPADALPLTWEAQTRALRLTHTGMAVINDTVDDYGDIHPVRKKEVGERLALLALAADYGVPVIASGPTFENVRFNKGEDVVSFDHAEGLTTRDGRAPDWFEIAGADGKVFPADAVIHVDTVALRNSSVTKPSRVRLGWGERAKPNLINQAGLPARPFNTDY